MLGLMLHAELNGVTDLDFVDDPSSPYIFTFKIQYVDKNGVDPTEILMPDADPVVKCIPIQ